ncbi:MAG: manganese-dependent inorganic pyrophosphatase [Candidatus Moranbacteria bacterium]|nr:manganese-dependent inorganic pyrophosphatase [Candidatus Moranbacteria bacterium]
MAKTIIIGHKNPDTDSVVAALAAERYYKEVLKIDAKAYSAGEINNETKFVLKTLSLKAPSLLKAVKKDDAVVLVDHNESGQIADGISASQIAGLIDHHKIIFETERPISIRVEPIGSTSSLIAKMYFESGRKVSASLAKLLLSGILSDTLGLSGPTTTDEDRKIVKALNKIANIDIKEFVSELFAAKSSLKGISIETLITQDYKLFEMGRSKVGIGVWETTDPESVNAEKAKILKLLFEKKFKENLDYIFFFVVDIIKQGSVLYLISDNESELAKKVFKGKIEDNGMVLEGIVSRKKQMAPVLTAALSK